MTLRESLGGDARRVYEQIDTLLDSQDGLLLLFDGGRMVSYAQGFGASPCQLELLSVELERAVRNIVGAQPTLARKDGRNRENSIEGNGGRHPAGLREPLGRHGRGDDSRVVDGGAESDRSGDAAHRDRSRAAGRVLRMASKTA